MNANQKYNLHHWESNARKFKASNNVSWGDINMMNLEVKNISKYIKKKDIVLDVGCSNGFSTFKVAKIAKKVHAFDYSKTSIKYALQRKTDNIKFYNANILDIPEQENYFDKAYTIRVLINIMSWESQKEAILEIYRVLKPKGLYLMSEAFMGGLNNINKLRQLANLQPLKIHNFDLYLSEEKFEEFIKNYFDILAIKKFSSIYYVASRFLRYLTLKENEKDTFVNKINNFFADYEVTENSGDFGIQKLYVLRKKEEELTDAHYTGIIDGL